MLNKAGIGEGRLAGPSGVAAETATGIELRNYDQLASRLMDVRRESTSS